MARLAEQDRAKHAFERVQPRAGGGEARKYRGLVRNLPAMVQQCGLGQTLAFLKSKRGGEHGLALEDLESWLGPWFKRAYPQVKIERGVLLALMEGDSRLYRIVTGEALAYLQWLKRFAEAAIERGEEGE